ncbi:MAG: PKD domain-containing protein [Candidatus Diapherotrites archaeon]
MKHKRWLLFFLFITVFAINAAADLISWQQSTNTAWDSAKGGHAAVVFNGKMWVLGGSSAAGGPYSNDVWSSVDGITWAKSTITSPSMWDARTSHTAIVYDNKIWVMGGWHGPNDDRSDVWYSIDGSFWTRATQNAPWGERSGHAAVVFDGKMWVLGGTEVSASGTVTYFNDAWWSTDGTNWTQETASAPWGARFGHSAVVYNNKIWVIGGKEQGIDPSVWKKDVWSSSADGTSWAMNSSIGMQGRGELAAVEYDGKMWVFGGYYIPEFSASLSFPRDVWYSTDGTTWARDTSTAGWPGRKDFTALVYSGKIFLMGGVNGSGGADYLRDVWTSNWISGCPDSQRIFRINATTNAHGEQWNLANYSTEICVPAALQAAYVPGATPHACTATNQVVRLYGTTPITNAHGERTQGTTAGYSNVCLGNLQCITRSDSCDPGETCVVKLSDLTNAHFETCSETNYNYFVCCNVPSGPVPNLSAEAGGPYNETTGVLFSLAGAAIGGTPPYNYSWAISPGAGCPASASGQNPSITCTGEGSSTATLTVTDSTASTDTDDAPITVSAPPACTPTETPNELTCNDGFDNDCDTLIDCSDPDCSSASNCISCTPTEVPEITCDDLTDNDCDNLIDCADPDCSTSPACITTCTPTESPNELTCDDGIDNDCDGLFDCGDSDCSSAENCVSNQPPTATLSANQTSGTQPFNVTFDAQCNDSDGTIFSCELDFGDGSAPINIGSGTANVSGSPSHSYNNPGTFNAVLTAVDNQGAIDTDTATIMVSASGTPSCTVILNPNQIETQTGTTSVEVSYLNTSNPTFQVTCGDESSNTPSQTCSSSPCPIGNCGVYTSTGYTNITATTIGGSENANCFERLTISNPGCNDGTFTPATEDCEPGVNETACTGATPECSTITCNCIAASSSDDYILSVTVTPFSVPNDGSSTATVKALLSNNFEINLEILNGVTNQPVAGIPLIAKSPTAAAPKEVEFILSASQIQLLNSGSFKARVSLATDPSVKKDAYFSVYTASSVSVPELPQPLVLLVLMVVMALILRGKKR